jgi:acetyl-CoA synthetase
MELNRGITMSSLLNKFVPKTQFDSYEDFKKNFKIKIPENFNFAFDVVDEYAKKHPDKVAMVWCDDNYERTFTFKEMKLYSDKAANLFKDLGIVKGQTVMLTLKSRYEFWFCLLGLNKIGAVPIPATHMLKTKDIVYRIESADIKMIVCIAEDQVPECVDEAEKNLKTNKIIKAMVGGEEREGWINFRHELEKTSEDFKRPIGKA